MLKEYKTVLRPASAEYEEKKSRFIATVIPVASEEEAVEHINRLKSTYWDARHNVYAYSLGGGQIIQRYSDDGEPSGTAGVPVLEVIKRQELQDVVIVVTRYFGGILLGAAGLIRAYGKSAALGLEAAGIVRRRLCAEMAAMVEYTLFGRIQSLLLSRDIHIKDIVYGQDVEIKALIPIDDMETYEKLLTEASNGRALIAFGEKEYLDIAE